MCAVRGGTNVTEELVLALAVVGEKWEKFFELTVSSITFIPPPVFLLRQSPASRRSERIADRPGEQVYFAAGMNVPSETSMRRTPSR